MPTNDQDSSPKLYWLKITYRGVRYLASGKNGRELSANLIDVAEFAAEELGVVSLAATVDQAVILEAESGWTSGDVRVAEKLVGAVKRALGAACEVEWGVD